jgi:hypothetical protein
MHDFHAHNAVMKSEDVLPAGTRAILINALDADSKDRENNGRSRSKDKSYAFGHGC